MRGQRQRIGNGSGPARVSGAMTHKRTIGWLVDAAERVELLLLFPPRFANVVAHHVTIAVNSTDALPAPTVGDIVGIAEDDCGVQALVIAIHGSTDRPDGKVWHVTWSLAEGRRPWESNDIIAAQGWRPIDLPVPVTLHPSEL